MKSFKKVQTQNQDLNSVQSNIEQFVKPLVSNALLDSVILKNINLEVGDNQIDHKLGRELLGWVIVKTSAASAIYDKQSTNSNSSKLLILNASVATTVSILVF